MCGRNSDVQRPVEEGFPVYDEVPARGRFVVIDGCAKWRRRISGLTRRIRIVEPFSPESRTVHEVEAFVRFWRRIYGSRRSKCPQCGERAK